MSLAARSIDLENLGYVDVNNSELIIDKIDNIIIEAHVMNRIKQFNADVIEPITPMIRKRDG